MKPELLSFIGATVPLNELASIASQGTGLSITNLTDRSPISFSPDAQYLIALANLTGITGPSAIDVLRNIPNRFLNALSYTVIFACDINTYLEAKAYLQVQLFNRGVQDKCLVLGTGPLREWHGDVVYNLMTDERSFEFRLLVDSIYLGFEQIGLGHLWSNYKKRQCKDKTFLLEQI